MSALAQGGQFPPSIQIGGSDPASADPSAGGQAGAPDNPDAEQALEDALDALNKFQSAEVDHVDKAVIAKCIAQIQNLLGSRQKGAESMLGVTPAHKAMARASGNGTAY